MSDSANLTNHFLIAMPSLADPNFFHTVTYICEHSPQGTMGLIINRPTEIRLGDLYEQMEIDHDSVASDDQRVYLGGPVQTDRGFILHTDEQKWDSTLHIARGVSVTTSRDILEAMANGQGPKKSLVTLGYAGWAEGQLERELSENAWLSGPADIRLLFETPSDERWMAAAQLMGVDLNLLSGDAGHA
jgi:putative transcriptional regulator